MSDMETVKREREEALAEAVRLREALLYVRDIEKPMCGDQPETDWLAWYSTSSQQTERAEDALSSTPRAAAVAEVVEAARRVVEDDCDGVIHPVCWKALTDALSRLDGVG